MRIVQCHGCFDLLHIGHIRHLQAASWAGDYLIVTVTADQFVNKGPGRPVFSAEIRAEALSALKCVNEVHISKTPTAAEAIREIRPAVYAKGPDYSEETLDPGELAAVREVGAELLFTDTEKFSSTALLKRTSHAPEVEAYLSQVREKYSAAYVRWWLDNARGLRVLVIGEAITDEYVYCWSGTGGKDPIVVSHKASEQSFNGGSWAVAGHVGACADTVKLLHGPAILKQRFIERYPFQKLFGVDDFSEEAQAAYGDELFPKFDAYDLVILADYGHGLLTPGLIRRAERSARKLAINVQANAANYGFSTLDKYSRVDFASLSERELRLNHRDRTASVLELLDNWRNSTVLVTRGEKGCMLWHVDKGGLFEAPALASHAVDRVGAGDAVFGVCACLWAVGAPLDLISFIAAVVGTMAVGIVGNARYIEREALWQAIEGWLA